MRLTSASIRTMSKGEIVGRTGSPNESRPRLPMVRSPNVNLCSGVSVQISAHSLPDHSNEGCSRISPIPFCCHGNWCRRALRTRVHMNKSESGSRHYGPL
jgi:hypothetical protein